MKTFDVEIRKTLKITEEDIDDIMVAALEGGINYWANKAEVVGECLNEWASHQISKGGAIRLHDYEEDEWYELTLEKFLSGIGKWYEKGGDFYEAVQVDGTLDCCNIDATVADSIVQYALFGEVVFG